MQNYYIVVWRTPYEPESLLEAQLPAFCRNHKQSVLFSPFVFPPGPEHTRDFHQPREIVSVLEVLICQAELGWLQSSTCVSETETTGGLTPWAAAEFPHHLSCISDHTGSQGDTEENKLSLDDHWQVVGIVDCLLVSGRDSLSVASWKVKGVKDLVAWSGVAADRRHLNLPVCNTANPRSSAQLCSV